MKVSGTEIEAMHQELIARGAIAPNDKWCLVMHPLDKGKVEMPAGADLVLSRTVPLDYVYVTTQQQAREWFKGDMALEASQKGAG